MVRDWSEQKSPGREVVVKLEEGSFGCCFKLAKMMQLPVEELNRDETKTYFHNLREMVGNELKLVCI